MVWRVQTACGAELPAVYALLERCHLPVDGLDGSHVHVFVVRAGERIIGCAAVEWYGVRTWLRSVAVHPEYRRRGVGTTLVRYVLQTLRQNGGREVYLLTTTAVGFFRKFGFDVLPRTAVPAEVRQSVEFSLTVCESATAMWRAL